MDALSLASARRRRSPGPWAGRTARRIARLAAVGLLVGAGPLGVGAAQTVRFGATMGGAGPAATLQLDDVAQGDDRIAVRLDVGADPGASLAVRRASAVGPIGTWTLEVHGAARFGGPAAARARLGARGTLGPVAARIEGRAWGAPPERFDPLADPAEAPYARGVALSLGADGRLDRTWLAGAGATVARAGDGRWAADLGASLRGRRLLSATLDGAVAADGRLAGAGDGRVGIGAGVVIAPRRAPEIAITGWLDAAPTAGGVRVAPGLTTTGAVALGADRLEWSLRARPAGPGRAPWFASATWRRPAADGRLAIEAAVRAGGSAGTAGALGVTWERPLDGAAWR